MLSYCNEQSRKNCTDLIKMPSKKLMIRYGLKPDTCNSIAWNILERYFDGKLIDKEDVLAK